MNAPLPRGLCPTLAAPMQTGDGLLVRLHPVASGLSSNTLIALCKAALGHGNGIVEVTARGNLQIRGLTAQSALGLSQDVDALGIAVRTGVPVETGPLAGLDAQEIANPTPLAKRIRAEHRGGRACSAARPESVGDRRWRRELGAWRGDRRHQADRGAQRRGHGVAARSRRRRGDVHAAARRSRRGRRLRALCCRCSRRSPRWDAKAGQGICRGISLSRPPSCRSPPLRGRWRRQRQRGSVRQRSAQRWRCGRPRGPHPAAARPPSPQGGGSGRCLFRYPRSQRLALRRADRPALRPNPRRRVDRLHPRRRYVLAPPKSASPHNARCC